MNFGKALEAIKSGKKARRKGWNGKNQYIELAYNISYQTMDGEIVNCNHDSYCICRNVRRTDWLASQADMLADDWEIVG